MSNFKPWTKEEDKILRKMYPVLGTKVQEFFVDRSLNAIDHRVRNLGVKFGLFEEGEEGYFDIETTNLNADFAFMLSYCIKVRGKDEIIKNVIRTDEIHDGDNPILDKRIVQDLINDLKRFKRVYVYYGADGRGLDVPFSRTRALANKLDFIPYGLIQVCDIWYIARSKLRLSHKRLDNVCDLLGIEGKNHLDGKTWILATTGNQKALDYVLDHNERDVVILEKVHRVLEQYSAQNRRYM
jgi:uncharacterized protein YprB with RNaseH-like and TPR domain